MLAILPPQEYNSPAMSERAPFSYIDPHIHTTFSDGMSAPAQVVEQASRNGLQLIAVTDHHLIDGALAAKEYAQTYPDLGLAVIIGLEHHTEDGHLIILFPNEQKAVDSKSLPESLTEAIIEARKSGALTIIPHLDMPLHGISSRHRAIALADGIEVLNGYLQVFRHFPGYRPFEDLNFLRQTHRLAAIGASDAHHAHFVGGSLTMFKGQTIEDFVEAVRNRTTIPLYQPELLPTLADWLKHVIFLIAKFGPRTLKRKSSIIPHPVDRQVKV